MRQGDPPRSAPRRAAACELLLRSARGSGSLEPLTLLLSLGQLWKVGEGSHWSHQRASNSFVPRQLPTISLLHLEQGCLRASHSQCEKRPQEQHLFPNWGCSRWPGALTVTSNMCWDKMMRLRAECHFSSWRSLAGRFQRPEVYRSSNLLQKADSSWL